jgi:hypothetical protein
MCVTELQEALCLGNTSSMLSVVRSGSHKQGISDSERYNYNTHTLSLQTV